MTNKKPDPSSPPAVAPNARRQALKAAGVVAGTGTLAMQWKKPVVGSVVLPAHAGLSVPPACLSFCTLPACPPEYFIPDIVTPDILTPDECPPV